MVAELLGMRRIRNLLTKHNLKMIPEFFVVGLRWV